VPPGRRKDTWASQSRQGTPEPQHPPPGAARVGPGRPAIGPACWASPRAPRPADRQMSRAAQNAAARAAHGPACASKARTRRPLAPPHRCPVAASPKWVSGQAFPDIHPDAVSCSRWPAHRRGRRHQGGHQARPRPGLQHATLAWQRGVCGGLLRSPLVLALLLQSCRGGCSSPLVGGSPCYRQLRATAPCVGCTSSATSPYLQSSGFGPCVSGVAPQNCCRRRRCRRGCCAARAGHSRRP